MLKYVQTRSMLHISAYFVHYTGPNITNKTAQTYGICAVLILFQEIYKNKKRCFFLNIHTMNLTLYFSSSLLMFALVFSIKIMYSSDSGLNGLCSNAFFMGCHSVMK